LLDADPVADIANSRRIAGVMLRGRWLSASDLARLLEELRSAGSPAPQRQPPG
jgi:hypothetical protein